MIKFIKGLKSHRAFFLFGLSFVGFILSYRYDPDNGLTTILGGLSMLQGIWAVGMAHWARKALMPYVDLKEFFAKALQSAVGAGLALIAVAIVFVGLLVVFAPRAHAETIPPGAMKYIPMLKAEQEKYWPSHPSPWNLAGLVEQESCLSLTHSKCWNPQSRLKTAREEGAGLGQTTRAYRADGSLRFDTVADLRSKYAPLADLSWQNIYGRPDLQLRSLVLLSKESAAPFAHTGSPLEFGDSAYNGGVNDVQKARRICAMKSNCDPQKWFDNVELHCVKSRQILYGNQSACDINRKHVMLVFRVRSFKYRVYF